MKRMEHERQRQMQRKIFEDQMRALEQAQAQELLSIPYDPATGTGGIQHLAVSAPTTPPRVTAVLNGSRHGEHGMPTSLADKRRSVAYAPSTINLSPDPSAFSNAPKSMPASRRTSASEHDEELANHLQNLQLIGERSSRASPIPSHVSSSILSRGRYGEPQYNAGMMLDEQLDQEMHNAMRNLPTSDDDKFPGYAKVSTSSAALDLAHLSHGARGHDALSAAKADRRVVTNPNTIGALSASSTPLVPQGLHPPLSRRGSPQSLLDSLNGTTRSVPATPMGLSHNPLLKTPGTPLTDAPLNGRLSQLGGDSLSSGDLGASLSRLPSSNGLDGSGLPFNSQNGFDDQPYGADYFSGGIDGGRYDAFSNGTGPNAYHGGRYSLQMPGRPLADGKMNGLHGPKHKRGDMDREFNRFAGTRLEDLQGEISSLCKDQHGCRYLQKKLEEGNPEHRDMIFRETFGHFADLMTDPFGNYLCQKLLEYSTDEQRSIICESVAQDLVSISLNMHGTRAVQKMIDFLSTRRQADGRYTPQIHSIIVALSMHVVVLIKDLNGNHVIQKCLNKLAPDDNQFIYNAVALNCVEVATHRHGCCVLQRCIDHASDHQRVQLVNEITYNALTLVQDPYGNYVVQYILDLNDNRFSDAVIRQFQGNVCALSVQKFSSNVIEKCIRVAEHGTRKLLIEELLNRTRLEKLLRDSYGNYCVQTALDYADPVQRAALVEGIRPVLPLIRNTPYGKRIQNKLQREQMDSFGGYHAQQALVNMALTNQGLGAVRHAPPNSMNDLYGSPAMYSQPGYGQLPPQGIDGYVLQQNTGHASPSFQTSSPSFQTSSPGFQTSAFPYGGADPYRAPSAAAGYGYSGM
ncbi:ARM repeat-containing protein [Cylindrobasidium torrendii FP15055 ss-10]|uniref:ARM repeat-containing protein n=1 Tax=Cylindrobasidium torrendii FP15055 ss-10 TaxID=1314674 RepID=A0A0D7B4F2_9AGAR|nr:ARM repeat-containing protein [Cylindrobasidium torrendii FP15055 ss-10]